MSRDDKARRELYPLISEAIEKGYADLGCGFDISVTQAITPNMYNALMRAGYRKASDVAREIFAELEDYMFDFEDITHTVNRTIGAATFAILKKKYTQEK